MRSEETRYGKQRSPFQTQEIILIYPLMQVILATDLCDGLMVVRVPSLRISASSWCKFTNSASMATKSPESRQTSVCNYSLSYTWDYTHFNLVSYITAKKYKRLVRGKKQCEVGITTKISENWFVFYEALKKMNKILNVMTEADHLNNKL